MRLSAQALEQELTRLGFQASRAQRLPSSHDIERAAEAPVERRGALTGALAGAATGVALSAVTGFAAAVPLALSGAFTGAYMGWRLAPDVVWNQDEIANRISEGGRARAVLREEIERARALVAAVAPRPEDDSRLLEALRSGAVEIDGPGMMRALKDRLDLRREEDRHAAVSADATARAEAHEQRVAKARAFTPESP